MKDKSRKYKCFVFQKVKTFITLNTVQMHKYFPFFCASNHCHCHRGIMGVHVAKEAAHTVLKGRGPRIEYQLFYTEIICIKKCFNTPPKGIWWEFLISVLPRQNPSCLLCPVWGSENLIFLNSFIPNFPSSILKKQTQNNFLCKNYVKALCHLSCESCKDQILKTKCYLAMRKPV